MTKYYFQASSQGVFIGSDHLQKRKDTFYVPLPKINHGYVNEYFQKTIFNNKLIKSYIFNCNSITTFVGFNKNKLTKLIQLIVVL